MEAKATTAGMKMPYCYGQSGLFKIQERPYL
jgi:hypothetical protein